MAADGARVNEAVILCGGLGTRISTLIPDRPKALADVHGRPFIEWLILSLARHQGIRDVILATGHMGSMIKDHFGSRPWCGVRLSYSNETQPLGTAGALRLAAAITRSSRLLVLNGDTYCRYGLPRILDVHTRNRAMATLWLLRGADPSSFGSVDVDRDGQVLGFREKDAAKGPQLASAGVYLIEREALAWIPSERPSSLERDVFPALVGEGLFGVVGEGAFVDIGTPTSLTSAEETLGRELDALDCE